MLPPTIKGKARRREGDAAGEGKRFRRSRDLICFCFSSKTKKAEDGRRCVLSEVKGTRLFDRGGMIAEASPRSARWPIGWDSSLRALPALFRILIKNSGSARESAGNNRKEGVHVAAAPAPFLVNGAAGSASTRKEKRESTSDNHASARQRVEWPRADLFGYIIQVESGVTGTAV